VDNILEGSVQRRDNDVRINVQLIQAARTQLCPKPTTHPHRCLWRGKRGSPFRGRIAQGPSPARNGARWMSRHSQCGAYDQYLRGLALDLRSIEPANLTGAGEFLRQAVKLDPGFAVAGPACRGSMRAWPTWARSGRRPLRQGRVEAAPRSSSGRTWAKPILALAIISTCASSSSMLRRQPSSGRGPSCRAAPRCWKPWRRRASPRRPRPVDRTPAPGCRAGPANASCSHLCRNPGAAAPLRRRARDGGQGAQCHPRRSLDGGLAGLYPAGGGPARTVAANPRCVRGAPQEADVFDYQVLQLLYRQRPAQAIDKLRQALAQDLGPVGIGAGDYYYLLAWRSAPPAMPKPRAARLPMGRSTVALRRCGAHDRQRRLPGRHAVPDGVGRGDAAAIAADCRSTETTAASGGRSA